MPLMASVLTRFGLVNHRLIFYFTAFQLELLLLQGNFTATCLELMPCHSCHYAVLFVNITRLRDIHEYEMIKIGLIWLFYYG